MPHLQHAVSTPPAPPPASDPAPAFAGWKPSPLFSLFLFALLAVVPYLPALRAGFIWDDDIVYASRHLQTLGGLFRLWTDSSLHPEHYWPLLHTSFWLEYQIWGIRPAGYHLTNLLLHAGNTLLVLTILRRLRLPGAWFAAALFAVHPIHVESVVWIVERKDVLSGFFYLLSALCFIRFCAGRLIPASTDPPSPTGDRAGAGELPAAKEGQPSAAGAGEPPAGAAVDTPATLLPSSRPALNYAAALLFLLAAMLTKSVAISLPLALALGIWWKAGRLSRRAAFALVPFFLLAVAAEIFTGTIMSSEALDYVDKAALDLSVFERTIIAGRALWFYVGKLLWPHPLVPIYPRWEIDASALWQWLFPVSVALVLVVLFVLRRRIGRLPLAAALYFCVTLGPTLGFVDFGYLQYSYAADRFQYLASISLFALFAALAARLIRRFPPSRPPLLAAAVVLCVVFSALSWQHSLRFRSMRSYFEYTLEHNPENYVAWTNFAAGLTEEGRDEAAIEAAERAIELFPNFDRPHIILGRIHQRHDRLEQAVTAYENALKANPGAGLIRRQLVLLLNSMGRAAEALAHAETLQERLPDDAEAHLLEAMIHYDAMDDATALEALDRALAIDPDFEPAADLAGLIHFQLGNDRASAGDVEAAQRHWLRSIEYDPDRRDPYHNMAVILRAQGRYEEALPYAVKARKLPASPEPAPPANDFDD